MNWAQKIYKLWNDRDISELAKMTGIRPSTLYEALQKCSSMQAHNAIRLANAVGVTANWLFDDSRGFDSIEYLNQQASSSGEAMIRQVEGAMRYLGPDDPDIPAIHALVVRILQRRIGSEGTQPGAAGTPSPQPPRQQRAS